MSFRFLCMTLLVEAEARQWRRGSQACLLMKLSIYGTTHLQWPNPVAVAISSSVYRPKKIVGSKHIEYIFFS